MEGTEEDWDVRTTPTWLQPVALGVLGALLLYNLAGFHVVFRDRVPRWTAMTYWSMFTVGGWGNSVLEAEGTWNGETRPIDLPALFPTKWESGYRYSRSGFKRSASRLQVLGAATCNRLAPDAPDEVRFHLVRWTKVLGSAERKDERRELKSTWSCRRSVRLPGGQTLQGVLPEGAR